MTGRAFWHLALLTGLIVAPAQAGSWKFEVDESDRSSLTYSEDGKAVFYIGCGRAFGLHANYPGKAKKTGDASITITSGNATMTFKGDFEEPTNDLPTTFGQYDLGFRRQDPALYQKKWKMLRDRLLDLLDSGKPLTISAKGHSYALPPVDAKDWHEAFRKCG